MPISNVHHQPKSTINPSTEQGRCSGNQLACPEDGHVGFSSSFHIVYLAAVTSLWYSGYQPPCPIHPCSCILPHLPGAPISVVTSFGTLCSPLIPESSLIDSIKKIGARQWWHTPLIPALGRQRQVDFWVRGQPGLQTKFQDSQDYTEKPCLKKKKWFINISLLFKGLM